MESSACRTILSGVLLDAEHQVRFRRPDGRVIPWFGYTVADMRDGDEPSAEVREPRAVYQLHAAGSGR